MTPEELRRIRTKVGLSLDGLAKVLRIADLSTVHRWEKGRRTISGPASIILEMLDAGELPERYSKPLSQPPKHRQRNEYQPAPDQGQSDKAETPPHP